MTLNDLLKGKTVRVMTDAKVYVPLEIKSVEEKITVRELEPATRENDWWPKSESNRSLQVVFTNGFTKSYNSLSEIEILVKKED